MILIIFCFGDWYLVVKCFDYLVSNVVNNLNLRLIFDCCGCFIVLVRVFLRMIDFERGEWYFDNFSIIRVKLLYISYYICYLLVGRFVRKEKVCDV